MRIMYLVEKVGHVPYTTRFDIVAEHAKVMGWTVSPIYSALTP